MISSELATSIMISPALAQALSVPTRSLGSPLWDLAGSVPSLDLRFAENRSLVDVITGLNLITFSRTSDATFVDSNGLIQTASAGTPRFDHSPITGESLGLLVEEQRTNLLLQSSFSSIGTTAANGVWYESFPELDTTVNAGVAPDGTTTAALLSINASTVFRAVIQRTAITTAGTYSVSVYLKPNFTDTSARIMLAGDTGAVNFARADFTLSGAGGAPGSASVGGTAVSATAPTIQALPNGWFRCTVTATLTAPTGITVFIYPGTTGSQTTNSQTLVWGAQLEVGAFTTSYIPTGASAVTRAADVASISGSNFSSWYRQDEGTIFADCSGIAASGIQSPFYAFSDSSASNEIYYRISGGNGQHVVNSGGVAQVALSHAAVTTGQRVRAAFALAANNFAASQNGASAATSGSGLMPVGANQFSLGFRAGASSQVINGHIRRLVYWGQRLPNNVLQAITQ